MYNFEGSEINNTISEIKSLHNVENLIMLSTTKTSIIISTTKTHAHIPVKKLILGIFLQALKTSTYKEIKAIMMPAKFIAFIHKQFSSDTNMRAKIKVSNETAIIISLTIFLLSCTLSHPQSN